MVQDLNIRFGNIIYLFFGLVMSCISIKESELTLKGKLDKSELIGKNSGLYVSTKTPLNGFYLFNDGGCFHQLERYFKTQDDLLKSLNDSKNYKKDFHWGAYIIEKNEIKIQQYLGVDGNGLSYKFEVFTYLGEISNDSTITIKSRIDKDGNVVDMNNRVFTFNKKIKLLSR